MASANEMDMRAAALAAELEPMTRAEKLAVVERMKRIIAAVPVGPGEQPPPEGRARLGLAAIVGPSGSIHYRRPPGHPDLAEAVKTPGYCVAIDVPPEAAPAAGGLTAGEVYDVRHEPEATQAFLLGGVGGYRKWAAAKASGLPEGKPPGFVGKWVPRNVGGWQPPAKK
jgi:hypothetical protein